MSLSSRTVVARPFSRLGIWMGQRVYVKLDEARLRRVIWTLLGALGAVSAVIRMAS